MRIYESMVVAAEQSAPIRVVVTRLVVMGLKARAQRAALPDLWVDPLALTTSAGHQLHPQPSLRLSVSVRRPVATRAVALQALGAATVLRVGRHAPAAAPPTHLRDPATH